MLKTIDIAVNLTDTMFRGIYRGKSAHQNDFESVITRAKSAGVQKIIATGTDLEESRACIELAKQYPGYVYATVGCHPTRCDEFLNDPEAYIRALKNLIVSNLKEVVSFGEFGLDYGLCTFDNA
jgi:TatD DNase family protein